MDDVEAVRRLNELINRLEKAKDELFEEDGTLTVLSLDGVDAQLVGLLRGVVENEADIRVSVMRPRGAEMAAQVHF